jgi:hypothetical protein
MYTQTLLALFILGFAGFFSLVIAYMASSSYRTRHDRFIEEMERRSR